MDIATVCRSRPVPFARESRKNGVAIAFSVRIATMGSSARIKAAALIKATFGATNFGEGGPGEGEIRGGEETSSADDIIVRPKPLSEADQKLIWPVVQSINGL